MNIIKLNYQGSVVSAQSLRVPKVDSPDPDSQTFYLSSEAEGLDKDYVIRTRRDANTPPYQLRSVISVKTDFLCSCPDFTIRRWAKHEDCKHITIVRGFADRVGGVAALARMVRSDDQL